MHSLIEQVKQNIETHRLFEPGESIAIAASGGKDSVCLIKILKELGYKPTVLAVDNGIAGYSAEDMENLRHLCEQEHLLLKVFSFKEEYGKTLDELGLNNPCKTCASQIRQIITKKAIALGFRKVALGHNRNDRLNAPRIKGGQIEVVMPMFNIPEEHIKANALSCPHKRKPREPLEALK
jgi:cytoplasmic tRNA 2-thiolation protein 1